MVLIKTTDNETKQETFELQDLNIAYRINEEQAKIIRNNTMKLAGNIVNTGEDTLVIDFIEPVDLQYAKDNIKEVINSAFGWFNMYTGETRGEF